jgi:hypothetical protein
MYYVLCICYIGGIRILERLSWGMAQKRLGNAGLQCPCDLRGLF